MESLAARFKSKFLSQDRNALIDFLRGLSLIMVIFSHYGIYGYLLHAHTYVILGRVISDVSAGMGYYGVVVFFVISGYLITSLTLRRYAVLPNINFSEFWWFRFSRIMPMLALCILTIIIFNVYELPGLSGHSTNDLIKGISGILSFRFNEILSTTISGVWNPLWSLSVEEMFYFVFPFVCLFLTGCGAIAWIFLTIFSTIIYFKYSDTLSPYSTLANVDYLALGCLTALAKPSRLREYLNPLGCKVWAYILVVCGLACIAAGFVISGPFETHFYTLLTALGAVLVLIASQLSSLSATKRYIFLPFTVIGLVSYEAYLIHMPLRDLLTLYGIHNSFYHILIVILSAITVCLY
jgi:peptidoglycan/LPS O-acetylase OafA/YrhL